MKIRKSNSYIIMLYFMYSTYSSKSFFFFSRKENNWVRTIHLPNITDFTIYFLHEVSIMVQKSSITEILAMSYGLFPPVFSDHRKVILSLIGKGIYVIPIMFIMYILCYIFCYTVYQRIYRKNNYLTTLLSVNACLDLTLV